VNESENRSLSIGCILLQITGGDHGWSE